MIIRRDIEQGSAKWLAARAGIPTASDFGKLMKLDFTPRTGEMPATYLMTKVAEKYLGRPIQSFGAWATEQGNVLEEKAWPALAWELDKPIDRVGLCTTDDKRIACSPDGIIWKPDTGVEIKCLQPVNHVKCIYGGVVPDEYLAQIHGGMFVTGFQEWYFYAYSRLFPTMTLKVQRDEEIQVKIGACLTEFLHKFDESYAKLVARYGPPSTPIEDKPIPAPVRLSDDADIWKGI